MTPEQQFLDSKVQQALLRDIHGVKTAGVVSDIARRLYNIGKKGTVGTVLGGLGGAGLSLATGGAPLMMIGGGAALGGFGGISRGLFQRAARNTVGARAAGAIIDAPERLVTGVVGSSPALNAIKGFSPALPLLAGGGIGYAMADDGNKLMGTGLGVGAGLLARPLLMRGRI
jgi:hypothetical protein